VDLKGAYSGVFYVLLFGAYFGGIVFTTVIAKRRGASVPLYLCLSVLLSGVFAPLLIFTLPPPKQPTDASR
jgi:hypothetical protein